METNSNVDNVSSNLEITSGNGYSLVGGLIGYSYHGTIGNSSASGIVNGGNGNDLIGGLVGYVDIGHLHNSSASGVVGGGAGNDSVGGLIGESYGGVLQKSSASGAAVGGGAGDDLVGGLIGRSASSIRNGYSSGAVSGGEGDDEVGGLVGRNWWLQYGIYRHGSIGKSYSSGAVDGNGGMDKVGGLVGSNISGVTTASYYNDSATLAGETKNIKGTAKSEVHLKAQTEVVPSSSGDCTSVGGTWNANDPSNPVCDNGNYDGWDANDWDFGSDSEYPILR